MAPYTAPDSVTPASPAAPGYKPQVVTWFKVYAWVLSAIYLILIFVGIAMALMPNWLGDQMTAEDKIMMPVMGIIYGVLGLIFGIVFIIGGVSKNKSWQWVYNLVLICIGMTSCTIAASIPLLIFWLKPECKAYYGRN